MIYDKDYDYHNTKHKKWLARFKRLISFEMRHS